MYDLTIRLSNPETESNLALRNPGKPPLSLLRRPEFCNGRTPNAITASQPPGDADIANAGNLVRQNQTAPCIPLFARHIPWKRQSSCILDCCQRVDYPKPQLAVALANRFGYLACRLPLVSVRRNVFLNILPHPCSEIVVEVGVVWILNVQLREQRLAVGRCRGEVGARHNDEDVQKKRKESTRKRELT